MRLLDKIFKPENVKARQDARLKRRETKSGEEITLSQLELAKAQTLASAITPTGSTESTESTSKTNTILIGVGVVAVAVIGFFVYKKFKK
jgi:LPXTG-motif cell wall-anchored protein